MLVAPFTTLAGVTVRLSIVANLVILVLLSKPASISLNPLASYVMILKKSVGFSVLGLVMPVSIMVVGVFGGISSYVFTLIMLFLTVIHARFASVQTPPLNTSVGRN